MIEEEFKDTKMYHFLSVYENGNAGLYAFFATPKALVYKLDDGKLIFLSLVIDFYKNNSSALATVSYSYIDENSQTTKLFTAPCHNKYLCDGLGEAKEWIFKEIEAGHIIRLYQDILGNSSYDVSPGCIERKHCGWAVMD